jgi:hypothetical protein
VKKEDVELCNGMLRLASELQQLAREMEIHNGERADAEMMALISDAKSAVSGLLARREALQARREYEVLKAQLDRAQARLSAANAKAGGL